MPSNRNNDKRIRESMEKYSSARYSKLEFLFAVSHCWDIPDTYIEENPTQGNTVGMKVSKMSQQTVPILIRLLRL